MAEELDEEKKITEPTGEEEPLTGGAEPEGVAHQARNLINVLVKTIKAFRLYPPENPALMGFRDQLAERFQLFLKRYPSFVLQIGEYEFSFQGKTLYENQDLKTSLAFLLYKDGLRELRFMQGLEDWELREFIDIFSRIDNINPLEDDLVTLIWEKDFAHISYLATDAFLEERPVTVPENVAQFRAKLDMNPPPPSMAQDFHEELDEEDLDIEEILFKVDGPSPFLTNRSVYLLTPEELEGVRKEVEAEIAPSSVFNIIDILFEILALEKDSEPFRDVTKLLQQLLDAVLTLGDFQKAADLLTRMNIVLKTYDLKDWQIQVIQQFIENAGESQRIERIGKILEKGDSIRLDDVSSYLVLMKPVSIQPLILVLGELTNSKARRVLCDVLCEIGKNNLEVITPFMDDGRWYLARNITYILGRIGKEQSLPFIQKGLKHQEARVRREAVQALGQIGGPKAFALLGKALTDENLRIRCMAVLNYARVGKQESLPPLLEAVQSKDFAKRDPAEIKAYFDAIGLIPSEEAVRVLEKLLDQKSWFGGGTREEIRFGAASALALIGSPKAKSILESGKKSKEEAIRRACEQATWRQPT